MNQIYDAIALEYAANKNLTKRFAVAPTLLEMAGEIEGKTLLDMGCGNGYFSCLLARKCPAKIVGVDISEKMIELAKCNDDPVTSNIKYIVGDVATLDLQEKFDIVTAIFVLNYAKTRKALLQMCKNIADHLNAGGRCCIITLTPEVKPRKKFLRDWRYLHPKARSKFNNGEGVICEMKNPETGKVSSFVCYYWDEKTYTDTLKDAGFTSIKWIYDLTVSEEARRRFGTQFWDEWKKTTVASGIICNKK